MILVVGEAAQFAGGLTAALSDAGYRVRHVLPGNEARNLGRDRFEADLSSPNGLAELRALLRDGDQRSVGGIINCLGLGEEFCRCGDLDASAATDAAMWTFLLVKEFSPDLEAAADEGGGIFMNITGLNGKFGLEADHPVAVSAAGTIGFTKAFRREYPHLQITAIDVEPHMPSDLLVGRVMMEFEFSSGLDEIGFSSDGRWQLALRERAPRRSSASVDISPGSVVLVTGGADGITADILHGLAAKRPQLVIVGRTELSADEPVALRGFDARGLRAHFLDLARASGKRIIPAEIEVSVNSVVKQRRIRAHLDDFRRQGATVEYLPCDVRDVAKFRHIIADVYRRYGRIDGVIHAAGVIEDKRILDKSPASFRRVFETKVSSAVELAKSLKPETLKFVVFFSSVSARFGNAGQPDYSAANEYLNKLANALDQAWPAQVVSINWGPWDAGMVSDELRRLYAARGIGLIPVADGVQFFLDELGRTDSQSAEVVMTCNAEQMQNMRAAEPVLT